MNERHFRSLHLEVRRGSFGNLNHEKFLNKLNKTCKICNLKELQFNRIGLINGKGGKRKNKAFINKSSVIYVTFFQVTKYNQHVTDSVVYRRWPFLNQKIRCQSVAGGEWQQGFFYSAVPSFTVWVLGHWSETKAPVAVLAVTPLHPRPFMTFHKISASWCCVRNYRQASVYNRLIDVCLSIQLSSLTSALLCSNI